MKPAEPSFDVLFPALTVDQRAMLLSCCTPYRYKKGQTIFAQGEPGSQVFLIEKGRAEVSVTSISGRRTILNQMGSGEVIGDIAMLDGGTRSAEVIAATEVSGHILTRQQFLAFLNDNPEMALAIIQELCRKLRFLTDLHSEQSGIEGSKRLALILLKLFDRWGADQPDGSTRLTERFSQSELGNFAGLARENVNRHIRNWTQDGVLESDDGTLVLHDPNALELLAQD